MLIVKPPFNYHGGKSRMASWIASHIPAHETYVEPFAGSAAVLFHKPSSACEVLNDADLAVTSFFQALRDHPVELEWACRMTPYSRTEFMRCVESVDAEMVSVVERARRFFTIVSQGFGSVPATRGWSRPAPGAPEAMKVGSLIERFDACSTRLARVHLECRNGVDILATYDSPDTLFYIDPPYLCETRSWWGDGGVTSGQRFKQDYRVEMSSVEEHQALLVELTKVKGAVVLSGKHADLYDDLLDDGWYRAEYDGGAGEVIWSNRPIVEHLSLF